MPTELPFRIRVYDKALVFVGEVSNPVAVTVTPRWNKVGTAEFTVDSDHRLLPALSTPGARFTVEYQDRQEFSGWVKSLSGSGGSIAGQVTISADDDLALLQEMVGYSTPANPIDTQPAKEDKRTGPAETVLKGFVYANKGRLAQPVGVAADLARGSTQTTAFRMVPLADKLFDLADAGGVGMSVRQVGQTLLFDVSAPRTYPRDLTEEGGTIFDWEWSRSAPTATRAVIGGPNEGTSREFKGVTDTARETLYGRTIETFVDAGSVELAADILKAGTDALAQAGPLSGFRVTLAETSVFAYGGPNGVRVGDQVSINIGPQSFTDVLREAALTWTVDEGALAVPVVGERSDDPDLNLAKVITQLARGMRDLRTR